MNLPNGCTLYLMTPPEQVPEAAGYGLSIAHLAYRVGMGPHLFRTQRPVPIRGGVMVLDHRGYDGGGSPDALCREVLQECAAKGFSGVFCDFEGPVIPTLKKMAEAIGPVLHKRGKSLYLPEPYAPGGPDTAKVVIPTAISGGSLRQRLSEAAQLYGPDRVALGLEWVIEDFTLPAQYGSGRAMTGEELERLVRERAPAVYFSDELCAHYFTYMRPGESAHFILYDDGPSVIKKLHVAASLGIREAFLPCARAAQVLGEPDG